MNTSWGKEVNEAALQSNTLAIAVFKVDGEVIFSNNAMRNLAKDFSSQSFINPTFSDIVFQTKEQPFVGFLTLGNYVAVDNKSIAVSIHQKENELLVLGEVDTQKLAKQNISMSMLNQQINNLQRQLIKEKKTLQRTLKELQNNIEEKNRFLGIAAHDLRNPIGAAYSYADLMIESFGELSDSGNLKFLKIIRDTSNYALNLLDELLDISKIESGKLELKLQQAEFVSLIQRSININIVFAQRKGMTLAFESCCEQLNFAFDADRIEQVLNNLISNAIKYSNPGTKVLVRLSTHENLAKLEVVDKGPGILPEEVSTLFDAFTKTSNKTTGGEKGTGLGLAIVKKIISVHQGSVDVISKVGEGSTFFFTLPLNLDETILSDRVV